MLVGLDEVFDADDRVAVLEEIRTFAVEYRHSTTRVVITSRVVGYSMADLAAAEFKHVMMQPFSAAQVTSFVNLWHDVTYPAVEAETRDERRGRLFRAIAETKSVASLTENPLLLTMIAIVNRGQTLPTKRCQLYEECVDVLLERWHIQDALQHEQKRLGSNVAVFVAGAKRVLLSSLASRMQSDSNSVGNIITEDNLRGVFEDHIKARLHHDEAGLVSVLIRQLRETHGILCWLGGVYYSFVHQTFLEYFRARSLAQLNDADLVSKFARCSQQASWEEILCLASGMVPSQRMGPCLDALVRVGKVELAARCVDQLEDRFAAQSSVHMVWLALVVIAQSDEWEALEAITSLAQGWKDDRTRELLIAIARSSKRGAGDAVRSLAQGWKNEQTRELLTAIAQSDMYAASEAVRSLAEEWKDDQTRKALTAIAQSDAVRAGDAVRSLAEVWKDNQTRELLAAIAQSDTQGAGDAVRKLAEGWRDDETRQVLTAIAQSDTYAASDAVLYLARGWKDGRYASAAGSHCAVGHAGSWRRCTQAC